MTTTAWFYSIERRGRKDVLNALHTVLHDEKRPSLRQPLLDLLKRLEDDHEDAKRAEVETTVWDFLKDLV